MVFSFFIAFGMTVILVEKGDDFPIVNFLIYIRSFLSLIHEKLPDMFDCPICCVFWMSLISDIVVCFITKGNYFLWPFSGFINVGITFIIYNYFNL